MVARADITHAAAAALSGEGTLGVSRADVVAAALSGFGTLGVGAKDVGAASDELRVTQRSDVEKLIHPEPVRWTKQELVVNSLFIVVVAYWFLPPTEQQYLALGFRLALASTVYTNEKSAFELQCR